MEFLQILLTRPVGESNVAGCTSSPVEFKIIEVPLQNLIGLYSPTERGWVVNKTQLVEKSIYPGPINVPNRKDDI